MVLPALLAAGTYGLIGNLDDLDTPLLLGVPAGIYLLPTLIWFTSSQNAEWGLASAYTVFFLIVTIALVVIYYRVVIRKAATIIRNNVELPRSDSTRIIPSRL